MLFQEKAAKELLEYNLRREGPIFEGDERYMFPAVAKFPDNQLSNISIGMLEELERTVKVQLAKQTNTFSNIFAFFNTFKSCFSIIFKSI